MDHQKLQGFTSFSINPQSCEILARFYPPHKIAGNIISFAQRTNWTKILQVFLTA